MVVLQKSLSPLGLPKGSPEWCTAAGPSRPVSTQTVLFLSVKFVGILTKISFAERILKHKYLKSSNVRGLYKTGLERKIWTKL